ncbi:hypothetical protein P154DRAFT_232556 [Amniculicola lignicola CBS 123094]|uniref:C2H2-type domain-containing protein n=1 Tax=Amniculicola lignicola CBS 123094 TaxID=1392246 RepID=A0A6A5WED2_9PLEO|nr:hypothetical protein P154DRAFT_232556 [Amniculicola lignicola CBS 123094]
MDISGFHEDFATSNVHRLDNSNMADTTVNSSTCEAPSPLILHTLSDICTYYDLATAEKCKSHASRSKPEKITEDFPQTLVASKSAHPISRPGPRCMDSEIETTTVNSTSKSLSPCTTQCNSSGSPPRHFVVERSKKKRKISTVDDDSDCRRKSHRPRPSPTEEGQPRFACPFFKMAPSRWRNCSQLGWTSLHRVKEHLYRRHESQPRCPRCFTTFPTNNDRDTHIRCFDCDRQPVPHNIEAEGVSPEQKAQLKSRVGLSAKTDEENWSRIYRILFPNVSSDSIPSPYCENTDSADVQNYQSYLEHFLPEMVQNAIEEALENNKVPVNESLKNTVAKIVRDCQESVYASYQSSPWFRKAESSSAVEIKTRQVEQPAQELRSNSPSNEYLGCNTNTFDFLYSFDHSYIDSYWPSIRILPKEDNALSP